MVESPICLPRQPTCRLQSRSSALGPITDKARRSNHESAVSPSCFPNRNPCFGYPYQISRWPDCSALVSIVGAVPRSRFVLIRPYEQLWRQGFFTPPVVDDKFDETDSLRKHGYFRKGSQVVHWRRSAGAPGGPSIADSALPRSKVWEVPV
jgi:hypothetical protein